MLYKEEQHFRRNLLWLVFLLLPLVILILLFCQNQFHWHIFRNPLPGVSILILAIFYIIPMVVVLYKIKLTTIVKNDRILYGWNIPGSDLNEILISDVKEFQILEYKFVGYGYRISNKYGTVYNVAGNKGLLVTTHQGNKLLIGTSRPEELKNIVEHFNQKRTS